MNWKGSYLKYVGALGLVAVIGATSVALTYTPNKTLPPKTTKGHLTLADLKHDSLSSLVSQLTPQEKKLIAYEELIDGVRTMPPDKAAFFKRYIIETVVGGAIAQQDPAAVQSLLQKLNQEREANAANPAGKYQFYHQWSGVLQVGPPGTISYGELAQDLTARAHNFYLTSGYTCLLGGTVEYQLLAGQYGTQDSASPSGISNPVAAVFVDDSLFESNAAPPPGATGKFFTYPVAGSNGLRVVGATGDNIQLAWSGGGTVYFNLSTQKFSSTPIPSTLTCANVSATPLVLGPNGFAPSA